MQHHCECSKVDTCYNGRNPALLLVSFFLYLQIFVYSSLEVKYPDAEKANVVFNAVIVDEEIRPELITRQVSVKESSIIMY